MSMTESMSVLSMDAVPVSLDEFEDRMVTET